MKKAKKPKPREHMRPEYNFSGGTRGKYARRYAAGCNVVVKPRRGAPVLLEIDRHAVEKFGSLAGKRTDDAAGLVDHARQRVELGGGLRIQLLDRRVLRVQLGLLAIIERAPAKSSPRTRPNGSSASTASTSPELQLAMTKGLASSPLSP